MLVFWVKQDLGTITRRLLVHVYFDSVPSSEVKGSPMNQQTSRAKNRKALIIVLWISITLGQVLAKTAQRPGEIVSNLVITAAVIGIMFGLLTLYARLHQSSLPALQS